MKVKAVVAWLGGKRTMAPVDIIPQLGKHTQYFEPFCGSMAVLLAKQPSQKETVGDLHGDLTNLAWVLQHIDSAERLYDDLQRLLFDEEILKRSQFHLESSPEPLRTDPPDYKMIERAYWYFVASWMGRNGTAGSARIDYQLAVRWTRGGGSPTVRFRNAIDSIPAWHERLRNVVILRRDAFQYIDRLEDDPSTAVYCDPPYPTETRSWTKNGSGSQYLHEFDHNGMFGDDHVRLAEVLRAYKKARIIVSSYDCPRIRELYAGWTFLECYRQKNINRQTGSSTKAKEAPEVLAINGPKF